MDWWDDNCENGCLTQSTNSKQPHLNVKMSQMQRKVFTSQLEDYEWKRLVGNTSEEMDEEGN